MHKRLMGCTLVLLGLAGCGNNDSAQKVPDTGPVAAPVIANGTSLKGLLKSDPAVLAGCEPQVVTVAWDISSLAPTINDVEVYAGDALFASGGSTGSSTTGPWTEPGSKFTLKGVPGGEVLDELVVSGPAACAAELNSVAGVTAVES